MFWRKSETPIGTDWLEGRFPALVAFCLSMIVHLGLLILLAEILLGTNKQGDSLRLTMGESRQNDAAFEMAASFDIPEPTDADPLTTSQMLSDSNELFGDLDTTLSIDDLLKSGNTSLGPVALTAGGSGSADIGLAKLGGAASFYGTEATGNRFVFVIDCSQSMAGVRWYSAVKELLESLEKLSPEQEFYIIGFHTRTVPAMNAKPSKEPYLRNDKKSMTRIRTWLNTMRLGEATRPASSLKLAISLAPDAIFFLSDGELRDNTVEILPKLNADPSSNGIRVPIHTVSLMSEEGRFTLQTIAEQNGGMFRAVDAPARF